MAAFRNMPDGRALFTRKAQRWQGAPCVAFWSSSRCPLPPSSPSRPPRPRPRATSSPATATHTPTAWPARTGHDLTVCDPVVAMLITAGLERRRQPQGGCVDARGTHRADTGSRTAAAAGADGPAGLSPRRFGRATASFRSPSWSRAGGRRAQAPASAGLGVFGVSECSGGVSSVAVRRTCRWPRPSFLPDLRDDEPVFVVVAQDALAEVVEAGQELGVEVPGQWWPSVLDAVLFVRQRHDFLRGDIGDHDLASHGGADVGDGVGPHEPGRLLLAVLSLGVPHDPDVCHGFPSRAPVIAGTIIAGQPTARASHAGDDRRDRPK